MLIWARFAREDRNPGIFWYAIARRVAWETRNAVRERIQSIGFADFVVFAPRIKAFVVVVLNVASN